MSMSGKYKAKILEGESWKTQSFQVLRNNDNKKELFCFIKEKLAKLNAGNKQILTAYIP